MDSLPANNRPLTADRLAGKDSDKYLLKDNDGWAIASRTWGERAVAFLGLKDGWAKSALLFVFGPSSQMIADREAAMTAFAEEINALGHNAPTVIMTGSAITVMDARKVFESVKTLQERSAQQKPVDSGTLATHGVLPGNSSRTQSLVARSNQLFQDGDVAGDLSNKLIANQSPLRMKGDLGHDLARIPMTEDEAANKGEGRFHMLNGKGASGFYMATNDKEGQVDNKDNFDTRNKQLEALFIKKYANHGNANADISAGSQALRELSLVGSMDGVVSLLNEINKQAGGILTSQKGSANMVMQVEFDDDNPGSILIKFEYEDKPEASYDGDYNKTELDPEKSFQNFSGTLRLTPSVASANGVAHVEAIDIRHFAHTVPIIKIGDNI